MGNMGKHLVEGIWNGIKNTTQWILDKIKGFGQSILDGMKSFFGIHSPSTLFRDEIGKFMAKGIGIGFEDEMNNVASQMQNAVPTEFDINTQPVSYGSMNMNLKDSLVEAFKEFKPVVILDKEKIGEFAFEYGNIRYGDYYK